MPCVCVPIGACAGARTRRPGRRRRRTAVARSPGRASAGTCGCSRPSPQARGHDVQAGSVQRRIGGGDQRCPADVEPDRGAQVAAEQAGDQQRGGAEIADRGYPDPRLKPAAARQRVGDRARSRSVPDERAEHQQAEHQRGCRLAGVIVAAHEHHRERLQAGEEEVPERGADDQQHVGGDAQHVAHRCAERHRVGIHLEHECGVGLEAALGRGLQRDIAVAFALPALVSSRRLGGTVRVRERGCEILSAGLQPALAAAPRLGHAAPQRTREEEPGEREQREGHTPREHARDGAADDESGRRAGDLAAEDVAVDAPAFQRWEVVAGQRRDRGAGRGGHRTQPDTREQQAGVGVGECAEQRCDAPQHDARRKQWYPAGAIDQSPTGITAAAPTSSATELSRPILVLPMCSERSSCGATAPIVAI